MKNELKRMTAAILSLAFAVTLSASAFAEAPAQDEWKNNPLVQFIVAAFGKKAQPKARPHQETVAALRELGIEIPYAVISCVDMEMKQRAERWALSGYTFEEEPYEFAVNLLIAVGIGNYDYATGQWTPTSSDVYAFDTEVYDVAHMYGSFLQGVASIVPGFEPAEIHEQFVGRPVQGMSLRWPSAEGKTNVSFVLNGNRYERSLESYGDWFNDEAISWINSVLEQEGFEGRLHPFYDGMQGLILLYGDDEYGQKLCEIIPKTLPVFGF